MCIFYILGQYSKHVAYVQSLYLPRPMTDITNGSQHPPTKPSYDLSLSQWAASANRSKLVTKVRSICYHFSELAIYYYCH